MIKNAVRLVSGGGAVLETDAAAKARASRLWLVTDTAGTFTVASQPDKESADMRATLTTVAATPHTPAAYFIDGPAGYLRVSFVPGVPAVAEVAAALEVVP